MVYEVWIVMMHGVLGLASMDKNWANRKTMLEFYDDDRVRSIV